MSVMESGETVGIICEKCLGGFFFINHTVGKRRDFTVICKECLEPLGVFVRLHPGDYVAVSPPAQR